MGILDQLDTRGKLSELAPDVLPSLCEEIRSFLVSNLAHTGGHLASNLGVVEITVALHRVLDTARDRLVFDVGHQCYTHKLLTGRKALFDDFRSFGALSGFPKPSESIHDAFATGHASTAVSAALGMARARTLMGEDYRVAALLGDGALTGGLAYEGLGDAGLSGEPMVVILNDNGMSITQNVGGIARYLARLRLKPQYFRAKKVYHKIVDPLPGGKRFDRFVRRIKTAVKDAYLPSTFFESMGFAYLGPADGHDVHNVERLLKIALELRRPVLLHLVTQKGRGYAPAEQNPSDFHGVSPFEVASGRSLGQKETTFSDCFGQTLTELADKDARVAAITAAMRSGVGLSGFSQAYPERFFDVGIAESHAVTMAAGLAKQGMRPVCAVYSTFLQRAYDQIVHDVALQELPVVLAVDRAGMVGEDGETHHGLFDPVFLCHVPHMTVWCPASFAELRAMLAACLRTNGPSALRYPRGKEGAYTACHLEPTALREGKAITLATYGVTINDTLAAAELLAREGIDAEVIKLPSVRPLEDALVAASVAKTGRLLFVEECVPEGSPGQRLYAALAQKRRFSFCHLHVGDRFLPHGSVRDLKTMCGLHPEGIAAAARKLARGAGGLVEMPMRISV